MVFTIFAVTTNDVLVNMDLGFHNNASAFFRFCWASIARILSTLADFCLAVSLSVSLLTNTNWSDDNIGSSEQVISTLWTERF